MSRLLAAIGAALRAALLLRAHLVLENVALRQQVAVLARKRPRPALSMADRTFWILLRRVWSGWAERLVIVKPDTVVRWHRAGFRLFWTWRSRRGWPTHRSRMGMPAIAPHRVLARNRAATSPKKMSAAVGGTRAPASGFGRDHGHPG